MQLIPHSRTLFGLVFPLLVSASLGAANTLTVGQPNTPCHGAQYRTITAAISAAAPFDTIGVCPALMVSAVSMLKYCFKTGSGSESEWLRPG